MDRHEKTFAVESVTCQKKAPPVWRQRAAEMVRHGWSIRQAARVLGKSFSAVHRWYHRAGNTPLAEVNWADEPAGCRRAVNRTPERLEQKVLAMRRRLQKQVLGESGAVAIHRELLTEGIAGVPTVRTIGRILVRQGMLDGHRRVRHPAPPRGWYLPAVAERAVELDSFDTVQGLALEGHGEIEIFNGISLHGGWPASWTQDVVTSKAAVDALLQHWRQFGLPAYAQFDNDTRFQGPRQYPDTFGRVMRLCLSLGVTPVFVPPYEPGFQAAIENFNRRWQNQVWRRWRHPSLASLQRRSQRYVEALRQRLAPRWETAPKRRPFPAGWKLNWQAPLRGKVVFLRRTTEYGRVNFWVRDFLVDGHWPHRLVRAEVDLDAGRISFYALRRREPEDQPLLQDMRYVVPHGRFRERE